MAAPRRASLTALILSLADRLTGETKRVAIVTLRYNTTVIPDLKTPSELTFHFHEILLR